MIPTHLDPLWHGIREADELRRMARVEERAAVHVPCERPDIECAKAANLRQFAADLISSKKRWARQATADWMHYDYPETRQLCAEVAAALETTFEPFIRQALESAENHERIAK